MSGISVTFTQTRIALATDLANPIVCWTSEPDEKFDDGGEVREYAGGRQRLITRPGSKHTIGVTVLNVDRTTKDLLLSWAGQLLLYRDWRGRRVWCSFTAPQVGDSPSQSETYDVALNLVEVSHDESV